MLRLQDDTLLNLKHVGKTFPSGIEAFVDVDLAVTRGEFLTLLGPSGCGKSTILRLIAGLAQPSEGEIVWAGGTRPEIGFVFQDPTLMPWASVFANVYLPLRLAGQSRRAAAPRIADMLQRVGLGGFEKVYPRELSGGMRMRVSLARALVTDPPLLLLDEPFAALDEITRFALNDDLLALQRQVKTTIVFVTHSVFESVYLSQRIAVMSPRPGRIVDEIVINAPEPRGEGFRTTPLFAEQASLVSAALRNAMAWESTPRAPSRNRPGRERLLNLLLPAAVFFGSVLLWEAIVRALAVPPYVLPAPSLIASTLVTDWPLLFGSLLVTLRITLEALGLAIAGGAAFAILLAQSRQIERALLPFAIILQVTPIIAIAPLLLVYLESSTAVLVCAFLVAFFPILSNTALGLASTDHNLVALFDLYRASRWRQLLLLRLPSALPYFLGGVRIGGGLALIGAIVAELAAGAAGQGSGLAFRITEAGYRLNIARMFAALVLISFTGLVIYGALALISRLILRRWHDSARAGGM